MNPKIDAIALLPEILLSVGIAAVLLLDLFINEQKKFWTCVVGIFATTAALIATVSIGISDSGTNVTDAFVVDDFALVAKGILLVTLGLVLCIGLPRTWKGEYCTLLLSSTLGMLIAVSARDFLLLFVALELMAIPGYLLVGWNKKSLGHEGALKYFLLGVVSSSVMLFGISYIYGIAGSTGLEAIGSVFGSCGPDNGSISGCAAGPENLTLSQVAAFFVIVGLLFKVSAVPFHFWAPDAYQAAPIPVAAFLSVATKATGFFVLIQVLLVGFSDLDFVWAPLIWIVAALTMTVGNLAALRQTDLVRLLAYSSVAQAGYLLVPLAVTGHYGGTSELALETVFAFVIIYAITNLGTFVTVIMASRITSSTSIESLRGLLRRSPVLGISMIAFFLSLAGIPPLAGWFAKLIIFKSVIEADSTAAIVLGVIAAINSAIGLVYYAGAIRNLWADASPVHESETTETPSVINLSVALGLVAIPVVLFGVLPGMVTYLGGLPSLTN